MPDTQINVENKQEEIILSEVVPTLFIALGGTGFEILSRIRRRILNTLWGSGTGTVVRLNSLDEFPLAEFLHIDLDYNTFVASGKGLKSDILADKVLFKEEERFIPKLELKKYISTTDSLSNYPLVKEWFPLTRDKIIELGINPEDGAGQIRSISRLFFFDKYQDIKTRVSNKASSLLSNINTADPAKRLGIRVKTGQLKIVVVASSAGGTGSGSFLDLGYLCSILGKQMVGSGFTANLVLLLPTGYHGAGLTRTQANSYATLMEMETCMRPGSRFIEKWSDNERHLNLEDKPYDSIYLVDSVNLAGEKTKKIEPVYEMVADALFEDFSTAEFANKKRSIVANKKQHKMMPYTPPINREKYGDMKLAFSRGYSTFGQSIIETHIEQKNNVFLLRQVNEMLKLFFGVAVSDSDGNLPTEKERDDILENNMHLKPNNEKIGYDFITKDNQFKKGVERVNFEIVSELLRVRNLSRLDDIERGIQARFDEIANGGNYDKWPEYIDRLIESLDNDTFSSVVTGSGIHEESIVMRRSEVLSELLSRESAARPVNILWNRLDNKEHGGLDYTIALIKRVKDRLENENNGIIKELDDNSKWFSELSGFMRNREISVLKDRLPQALKKWINSKDQSRLVLNQIAETVKLYVRYHLYAVASKEAAGLVKDLSDGLGKQDGNDKAGNPVWKGLIGEFYSGRKMVASVINEVETQIKLTEEAMKQEHEMCIVLPVPKSEKDELKLLPPDQAMKWASEAFNNFGKSQKLFEMLKTEKGRSELISTLSNMAFSKILCNRTNDGENPLFKAIDNHPDKQHLFEDFFNRAMPWLPSRLDNYLKAENPNEQYQCYIGVKDSKKFEEKYGALIRGSINADTRLTANEIGYVEIDAPGRVVFYTELTGIPLPSLRFIDEWFTSYNIEKEKIPANNHFRTSKFVHTRELTTEELAQRAADMKLFIQAVALGELTRSDKKGQESGLYRIIVKGSSKFVGDEKSFRQEGFSGNYRKLLRDDVELALDKIKSHDQIAIWIALMHYYHDHVYPLFEILDDGQTKDMKFLPNIKCSELVAEWTEKLYESMSDTQKADDLIKNAINDLDKWTDIIPSSKLDVYPNEVNTSKAKEKRVLKKDVLKPGFRLWNQIVNSDSYFIFVNGQQAGPFSLNNIMNMIQAGQLIRETLVFRQGMISWTPASLVPEIASFFADNFFVVIHGHQAGPYDLNTIKNMIQHRQLTQETMVFRQGMASWLPAAYVTEIAPFFQILPPPIPGTGTAMPPAVMGIPQPPVMGTVMPQVPPAVMGIPQPPVMGTVMPQVPPAVMGIPQPPVMGTVMPQVPSAVMGIPQEPVLEGNNSQTSETEIFSSSSDITSESPEVSED